MPSSRQPILESRVVCLHVVTGRIEAFIASAGVDALLFAYVYGQCIVCDEKLIYFGNLIPELPDAVLNICTISEDMSPTVLM